jgi:hypothetical protein
MEHFKLTGGNSRQQALQISRLLNLTLHHCEEAKTDAPALKKNLKTSLTTEIQGGKFSTNIGHFISTSP